MESYNKLKETVLAAESDAQKFFEKGNRSAGTRLRKSMQEIKGIAQQLRKDVAVAKQVEVAQ